MPEKAENSVAKILDTSNHTLLRDGRSDEKYQSDAVLALACEVSALYEKAPAYIKHLRNVLGKKQGAAPFSMEGMTQEEKEATVQIVNLFTANGLIKNATQYGDTIRASVTATPRTISFINGDFLELGIYKKTKDILDRIDADYELIPNAIVAHPDGSENEYDLLIRINDTLLTVECKSGYFAQFEEYGRLADLHGIGREFLILVTSDRMQTETECISFFFNYSITNFTNFSNVLRRMTAETPQL